MIQHGFLPPPADEAVWSALAARLLALAETDEAFAGSFIRHARVCSLHNLDLSRPCLTLVLHGVKHVQASGNRPELAVPRGGLIYFAAGQCVSITNEPEPGPGPEPGGQGAYPGRYSGGYLAFSFVFDPEALASLARRTPPETPVPAVAYERLFAALVVLLDMHASGADPTLRLMQEEQVLWLLRLGGVELQSGVDELASAIRRLVEASPRHGWSSAELARAMRMSERNLRRLLAGQGQSCSSLVRLGRLHVGLGLLQQGRPVEETAYACGYESRSRFSQRFQEHFGLTPTALLLTREGPRKST